LLKVFFFLPLKIKNLLALINYSMKNKTGNSKKYMLKTKPSKNAYPLLIFSKVSWMMQIKAKTKSSEM